jgi:hypothetical protein
MPAEEKRPRFGLRMLAEVTRFTETGIAQEECLEDLLFAEHNRA